MILFVFVCHTSQLDTHSHTQHFNSALKLEVKTYKSSRMELRFFNAKSDVTSGRVDPISASSYSQNSINNILRVPYFISRVPVSKPPEETMLFQLKSRFQKTIDLPSTTTILLLSGVNRDNLLYFIIFLSISD